MTNEAGGKSALSARLGVTPPPLPSGHYRTAAGSEMWISGEHGGISEVLFDWLEEPAGCCDCVVDAYEQEGRLQWSCDSCGGGSAMLLPVTPNVELTGLRREDLK